MVIAHNISALNTYKSLGVAGTNSDKSMEKLSSGYKINRAGDDAAGLSISEKMRSQIRGLNQASTNAENGVSMIQTAEGALNEEHSILQRMRELAVQSATDTNASEDREALQSELEQLSSEINRIGNTTEFNGMKILNGDKAQGYTGGNKAEQTIGEVKFVARETGKAGNEIKVQTLISDAPDEGTISVNGKEIKITFSANTSATEDKIKALIKGNAAANELLDYAKITLSSNAYTAAASLTVLASGADAVVNPASDNSVYFHVGANKDQVINASFNDMRAASLGITYVNAAAPSANTESAVEINGKTYNGYFTTTATVNNGTDTTGVEYALDISTRAGANAAIDIIDGAIKSVSQERSKYGAIQNRLEYTMNNLNTTAENMTAAESTIRDVDMASEMMELTKNNILQQAAQAMLVQANSRPQQALQLLQ